MNIDLKNINITDLKEQILKNLDKKTLIKLGIGVGSIIIFLIIYYAILNPIVKEKKAKLEDMQLKVSVCFNCISSNFAFVSFTIGFKIA